jgi:WhiB family redox-sensing transcriptional regulator
MNPQKLYLDLQQAIETAPAIPPCQVTDPELWFGVNERDDGCYQANYAIAKQLCNSCPVQNICLSYALSANEPEGVWGGLSPTERKKMRAAMERNQYRRPRARKYA